MSFATFVRNRNTERLIALLSAIAVLMSLMAVYASEAEAHNGTVTWDCNGWSIELDAYSGATIEIEVDGQIIADTSFQSTYNNSGTWDDTQSHTLDIEVDASDDDDQPVHTLGSNGSFSPDWQNGEYSFTLDISQDACNPSPEDVTTVVSAGSCVVEQGQATGSIDVTIDPASGATVDVFDGNTLVDSLTSSGTISDLDPGTYQWDAAPEDGYQLTGDSSGTVTIEDCEPEPEDPEISVDLTCRMDSSDGPTTNVAFALTDPDGVVESITIDGPGSFTTEVDGSDGWQIDLLPGEYTWSANLDSGYTGDPITDDLTVDDDCLSCPIPGAIDLTNSGRLGSYHAPTFETWGGPVQNVNIPAGLYNITLASYDQHFEHHQSQPLEIWALADGPDGGTWQSPFTPDLSESTNFEIYTNVGGGPVAVPEIEDLYTVHGYIGRDMSANSVNPVCAKFEPVTQEVDVSVTANSCEINQQGQAVGSIDIDVDPDAQATVRIYDDPAKTAGDLVAEVTSTDTIPDLGPGTYYWEADAESGYTLSGDAEGEVTIEDCESEVAVVALGVCEATAGGPLGSVEVTIDPSSSSEVTVYSDAGLTDQVLSTTESGTFQLAPGTFYWEATSADGFELTGDTSGQLTIEDCEVSVAVDGQCLLDGDQGFGEVSVEMSVADGAIVTVTDSDDEVVATLTESGTVTVPEGATYSWTATAADGFTITGPDAGDLAIEDCTRSIDIVANGVCDSDVPVLSWEVNPVNFDADEVTISWNDIDTSDPLHSSVQPLSGSMVWPGAVVENGVAADWPGWKLVDGEWVQGSDGYEDTRPTASVTFSVNPEETVDIEYPGGTPTCDGPPGEIIVEKMVQGEGSQDFQFTFETDGFDLADNTLAHGQSSSSGDLAPGDGYSVSEDIPTAWTQLSATCDDGSEPSNIDLSVGEQVTCTFVNGIEAEARAAIQVTVEGSCEVDDDEGEGLVDITMSVAEGATVALFDSDGDRVGTLTSDGTISVPEGATYTWQATPNEGFEFPPGFDSSGSITIETCSDPETLPFTGLNMDSMALVATVFLGAGFIAVLSTRRREE